MTRRLWLYLAVVYVAVEIVTRGLIVCAAGTSILWRNKTFHAKNGDITLTLNMKHDSAVYSESQSDLCWGLFSANNYRYKDATIFVGHDMLQYSNEMLRPLSNVTRVSISRSRHPREFQIHIAGGDASAAYWATITFRFIKSRQTYEPVSRVIRSAEFPKRYYEICTFHMWW